MGRKAKKNKRKRGEGTSDRGREGESEGEGERCHMAKGSTLDQLQHSADRSLRSFCSPLGTDRLQYNLTIFP